MVYFKIKLLEIGVGVGKEVGERRIRNDYKSVFVFQVYGGTNDEHPKIMN